MPTFSPPPKKPALLIFGANGQVGWELSRSMPRLGRVIALTRDACNLNDPASLQTILQKIKPTHILNAAAYTAVDKAETDGAAAERMNVAVPKELAAYAAANRCVLVHFSTDYVFSGDRPSPYTETDLTGPRNVYGATKQRGEQAVLASGATAYVFRLSWVFGNHGPNFPKTILRLAREREVLKIVNDQHGRPTPARLVAETVTEIMAKTLNRPVFPPGLYHLAGQGETTWHDLARTVLEIADEINPGSFKTRLQPITTTDYPLPAPRPSNSVLDCSKLETQLGHPLPHWKAYLEELVKAEMGV